MRARSRETVGGPLPGTAVKTSCRNGESSRVTTSRNACQCRIPTEQDRKLYQLRDRLTPKSSSDFCQDLRISDGMADRERNEETECGSAR